MDYKQFKQLTEPGGTSSKEAIARLQEFVNEFPYFQTAHAFFAKALHEQQHVRYDRQLKIASAYAGDRKSLYDLIHSKNVPEFSDASLQSPSPFISDTPLQIESESIFADVEEATIPLEETVSDLFREDASPSDPVFTPSFGNDKSNDEEFHPEKISEPEIFEPIPSMSLHEEIEMTDSEEDNQEETPVADPHEIIRRRLKEILGLKEEIKETPVEKVTAEKTTRPSEIVIDKKEISPVEIPKSDPVVELSEKKDVIDSAEFEHALEATIIQSLEKLPVIEKAVKEPVSFQDQRIFSFYDWLKSKPISGFGFVEEVHAYDLEIPVEESPATTEPKIKEKKNTDKVNELIERFIQTDPRIVPSKVEFYSPANQAKKSVEEDQDLVSETLAKIYEQQGNLIKARSAYQRLSLLYPEKMAYFAARISVIDNTVNNPDKEDL